MERQWDETLLAETSIPSSEEDLVSFLPFSKSGNVVVKEKSTSGEADTLMTRHGQEPDELFVSKISK